MFDKPTVKQSCKVRGKRWNGMYVCGKLCIMLFVN